jgi:uncharacterized protein with PIN domain
MRFLTEVSDPFAAAELVARLNDASCAATLEERPADTAIGGPHGRTFVYISEDADMEKVVEILQQFSEEGSPSRGLRCDGCGYDMRGHKGEGHCPECGHRFQIRRNELVSESVTCPSCGEDVPSDFDCCWNCGEAID